MKALVKSWVVGVLALAMAASVVFAQDRVPFRQEELDQMLAPVALYPDPLLSQILLASTHPQEVAQASRWSRANPGLEGQDAVRAAEQMDWDPSVKSLAAFPQVLAMMGENIGWVERLGEAFLAQQADVMDAVQGLRRRAEAAGTLRSTEQMRVTREGEVIYLDPPAAEIVYVPYYDPVVAYGPWWWPAYPPVYWVPPRAYSVVPARRAIFLWGRGIAFSTGFFYARPDWHRRQVTVVHRRGGIVNRTTVVNRPDARLAWEHNAPNRRAVPFSHPDARQRIAPPRVADARGDTDRRAAARIEHRAETDRRVAVFQRQREERRNVPHPVTRFGDARPAVATHVARPTVAPPVPRAATRAAPRNFADSSAAASRPAASTANPAPRMAGSHGARDRGARVQRDARQ